MTIALRIAALALLVSGCGGTVVVDGAGGSSSTSAADSSSNTSNSSTSTTMTSSVTGPVGCEVTGCDPDQICVFGSGQCAYPCKLGELTPCGAGLVCVGCVTGSCPDCDDCIDACLPAAPGSCDDHDDCAPANVCIYGAGVCAPACSPDMPGCPTPDLVCNFCATSSCPGCEDCVGACTESF